MTYLFLLLFIVATLLGGSTDVQDTTGVLDCLGYHELDLLYRGRTVDLDAETLAAWYALEGEDIWIGYEHGGFDVPEDVRRWFKLVDAPAEVWVWRSASEQAAYIFVMSDNTPVYENGGYVMHCCGVFKIDLAAVPDLP